MVLEKVSEVLEKSLNFFEKFLYCMNLKKIVLCIGCCVLSMEVITFLMWEKQNATEQ